MAQRGFDLLARHPRIALLHRTEQALLGGEQQTAAVYVNRSAFEHHLAKNTCDFDGGLDLVAGANGGDLFRKGVIELPVLVLGPGVELPVGERDFALLVFYEDGAGVTQPSAIGGPLVEGDARLQRG